MWLITSIGFFSVVQKPGDKQNGTLTVRSRVRSDLAALKQHYLPGLGPIQESLDTDYRFRAVAPRAEVSAAMARMIEDLDYGNFKSEVAKKQGPKRASLYHQVWDVLYQLQTSPNFVETEPTADSYGGVVVSGGHKVLLREPAKHHGGYAWTFAKTVAKEGESPRDAAIRAVREKTGYDTEIRISVPGVFKGSSSNTCYYVMDAKHPPAKPSWQTAALRWVNFDEARDLLRQSPNAEGRDRDLAILDAAEKVAGIIAYKEHPNVQPEDWTDLKSMPERHTVLYPKLCFNPDEMANIRRGFFPTVMEQKWFLYFTGERLRMHRSWTGVLIFDVGFAFDPEGGAYVTDVIVNRESREYSNTDDDEDLKLLEEIIRSHLLQSLEEPEVDGFVKAMGLAMQPKYLGSPEVVKALVKDIFDVAIRALAEEATEKDFVEAVGKVIAAFTDDNAGYTRMPGWHSAEQMGGYIKKYLIGSDQGEHLAEIIGNGMTALIAKLQEMLGGFLQDPAANWEEHALVQLNALHQFVVTVLLGTNTVLSGGKTLSDFQWVPIAAGAGNKQVIVDVGSEGGSLTLYGVQSPEGWQFRVETNESALEDDEDMTDLPERPWVGTWRSALKQLDAHPWTQLHPLTVHSEFCDRVFKALQTWKKKGLVIDWDEWGNVLKIFVDEEQRGLNAKKGAEMSAAAIVKAAQFAAEKHKNQRRKDADASPYINHPLALASVLAVEGGVETPEVICAALLHDTVEDTETTAEELAAIFGATVTGIVLEVTDDKSLDKAVRKEEQVRHAPHISPEAKLVKLADKICNLRDILASPPADWSADRKRAYFDWAARVVAGLRGVHPALEAVFDGLYGRQAELL